MVIQVLFRDPRTASETKYEFDQSPVRIGRNQLNNIVLEGNFVSGWHGIIRFDNTGTYFFDLGSTNGTNLDGNRVPKNTPIPITQTTRFTIWVFELIVTPAELEPAQIVAHAEVIEAGAGASSGRSPASGRSTKMMHAAEGPSTSSRAPGVSTNKTGSRPAGSGQGPPPPTNAKSKLPSRTGAGDQTADRLVRCLRIIGAFTDAFVGLKKGYEQFGSEVGVRPLSGTTPMHRARTSQEIIQHLLDPANDPDGCARDLNAVFADMGIHDVALMEGISQSVRGLLEKLDPNALDIKAGAGLWSGAKAKARWSSYVEMFNTLLGEDSALHAEIFGEEFARAYASVALGQDHAPPEEGDGDGEDNG
jgi:predicted component of type VI protein secretion system